MPRGIPFVQAAGWPPYPFTYYHCWSYWSNSGRSGERQSALSIAPLGHLIHQLKVKGIGALKASLLFTNPNSNINDYLRWRTVFCTPIYFQIRLGLQKGGRLFRIAMNSPLKSRLFTNPKLERTWWFLFSGTLFRKPTCCRIKQYKCWYKYM